jgi:GH25 family lysozyme M1 (1,4-beta-N-acetylmuramidase)
MTDPVPFRAGREALTAAAHAATPSVITGEVVLLADVSEFQPEVTDQLYLAWSKAIVIRAAYGTRTDKAWYGGDRRNQLHNGGVRFLGIYQYITASEDPAAQARALAALLGTLRHGEKVIADIEEGAGSQQARWVTWANEINAALGDPPWDYSGEFFATAHGLAPVDWIAAYGTREPDPPHQLWQFTDAFTVPGLPSPVDCSVFHGSIDQLAALAYQGARPAAHPVLQQGMTGPAVRTLQEALNTHGYHLAVDGVFGPATKAAVRSFQVQHHLAADGIAGPLTWAKLT